MSEMIVHMPNPFGVGGSLCGLGLEECARSVDPAIVRLESAGML